jgi:two-component system, cell cycle response regulator
MPAIILIVDDTPAGRDTLEELLFSPDYQLAFASNGPEALARAAALSPDLILLDVMMPEMDGFEVCRRLRADPHLAEVPVVMVTALDDRASRLQGIEAGADDFVPKPFDRVELRARVRTITRLNRYRRLLAERTRFAWVVEHADDGYLLINDEDDILYANPKAQLYFGLAGDSAELIPIKFLTQAQKQYRCEPGEAWLIWPPLPSPYLQPTRYLVRPESGTARATWLQVMVLDQPAEPGNEHLLHLRDVTGQMSLQRDRRTFHDMLSHKFRTPLGHITTSLEVMSDEDNRLSNQEMIELSWLALKGAHRLRAEIEDILHYLNVSRLSQGESGCLLAELPPILNEISHGLGLNSLALPELQGLEQTKLALSRRAMEWILGEILENTSKFHPHHSPAVEISVTHAEAGRLILKISDDGLTLSPEQLAQAWTPYYQGEKFFTGETAGMGLGLATGASLVWPVGGSCRLYNRSDKPGVVVELVIPVIPD